jgi:uncharacterized protein
VWLDGQVWLHNTSADGHLQTNVRHDPRVCFEVSIPGQVFAYGRYECDTSIEYQSIVVFGRVAVIDDRTRKSLFFDALMAKYHGNDSTRPKSFYPRLDRVTVYALTVERITGKEQRLPSTEAQWPAADNTQSPEALPPTESLASPPFHRAEAQHQTPAGTPSSSGTCCARAFTAIRFA